MITHAPGKRVCVYLRMSSDEQKLSIDQQRAEVRRHCIARGYSIVEEYEDAGLSGSKEVAKRKAFHRMISDAKLGRWTVIVVYNTSRFGRLDNLDGAEHKRELRRLGVKLESVTEGQIDWETSLGRITDALLSEQNHKYSRDLSDSILRGRNYLFDADLWAVGEVPYGFDRQISTDGQVTLTLPRRKPHVKARNQHTTLVINPAEADHVRYIFSRFSEATMSIRHLAKILNTEGVPPPGDKGWSVQILGRLLVDPVYIGTNRIGTGRRVKSALGRIEPRTKPDVWPVIIDKEIWSRVQAKLTGRKTGRTNTAQAKSGLLSGVLVCGNCGYRMTKRTKKAVVRYVCATASKRPGATSCRQWSVREGDMVAVVLDKLLSGLDLEVLRRYQAVPPEVRRRELGGLEAEADAARRRFEKAIGNLALLDPALLQQAQVAVLALKDDADRKANAVTLARNDGIDAATAVKGWWDTTRDQLITLRRGELSMNYDRGKPSFEVWFGPGRLDQIRASAEANGTVDANGWATVPLDAFTTTVRSTPGQFRTLMEMLKVSLTLHWVPATGGKYFHLSYGDIEATVGPDVVASFDRSLQYAHPCSQPR